MSLLLAPVPQMPRPGHSAARALLAIAVGVAVPFVSTWRVAAADHPLLGKQLVVKDPGTAAGRKILLKVLEPGSGEPVAGDPTAAGATLAISAYGGTPGAQVFTLPAEGWSGDAVHGFKYKDLAGAHGAVRRLKVKKSPKGVFIIQAMVDGRMGPVDIVPPNLGSGACARLELGGDESYSMRFGDGAITNKDGKLFRVKTPLTKGTCVACGNGFPDSGEACDPAGVACAHDGECRADCTCLYTAPDQAVLAFDETAAVAANGSYPAADPTTVCGASDRRFLAELVQGNPGDYRVPYRLADIKSAGSYVMVSGTASDISLGAGDFPFDHTFGSDFNMDVVLDPPFTAAAQRQGVVMGDLHVELAEGQFPHVERAPGPPDGQEWEEMSAESRQGIHPRFIPDAGARVLVMGHWIVDCGHLNFQTELHPITFMANARVSGTKTVVDAFYNPYRETQRYHLDPSKALAFDDPTRFTGTGAAPFPLALILNVLRLQDAGPPPYQSVDHLESWAMLEPSQASPVEWRVCAPPGSSGTQLDIRYHWIARPGVQIQVTPDPGSRCGVVQTIAGAATIVPPAPRVCVTPWDFLNEVAAEEAGLPSIDLQAELGAFIPPQYQSRLDPDPIMNCYDALGGPAPEAPPMGQQIEVRSDVLLPFYGTISVELTGQ